MKRCMWYATISTVLFISNPSMAGTVDMAGIDDYFGNGPDIAHPSPAVVAALAAFSGTQDFDLVPGDTTSAASPNRQVVHTFPAMPRRMVGAVLEFRVRAGNTSGAANDGIFLSFTTADTTIQYLDTVAYRRSFGDVPAIPPSYPEADPGLVGYWNRDEEAYITLDLSALPLPDGSTLDLIPALKQNNFLDVCISDDTGVDFLRMTYQLSTPVVPVIPAVPSAVAADMTGPRLLGNSPNPFRSSTSVQFSLQRSAEATIRVFDISGRLVRTVHRGSLAAGEHSVPWDGRNERGVAVNAGVYFYRLETVGFAETRKMIVVR